MHLTCNSFRPDYQSFTYTQTKLKLDINKPVYMSSVMKRKLLHSVGRCKFLIYTPLLNEN